MNRWLGGSWSEHPTSLKLSVNRPQLKASPGGPLLPVSAPTVSFYHPFAALLHLELVFIIFLFSGSVKEAAAAPGPAVAAELVAGVLNGKFVVVGELLSTVDLPQGKNDNVLLALHVDDAGVAVGFAGVVDESRRIAMHGRIHHLKVVNAEHVAANALSKEEQGGGHLYQKHIHGTSLIFNKRQNTLERR